MDVPVARPEARANGRLRPEAGDSSEARLAQVDPERLQARIAEIKAVTIAESLTTVQAARRLSVNEPVVRRRRANRRLYAFPLFRQWRYPMWQFGEEGVIPGQEAVVPAIPDCVHPAIVRAVMLAPRPLVEGMGGESPRDFLIRGGDPARVVALFETIRDL
jgi:hypothetical protein